MILLYLLKNISTKLCTEHIILLMSASTQHQLLRDPCSNMYLPDDETTGVAHLVSSVSHMKGMVHEIEICICCISRCWIVPRRGMY